MGMVGPNNTIVEQGGSFHLNCMPHDYWMTHGNYWYIYFTVTSIVCRVYAASVKGAESSRTNCTSNYDISRFRAYRDDYVLMLDVKNAKTTDAGLYVCAQPPANNMIGLLGLVGVVGVVCKLSLLCVVKRRMVYHFEGVCLSQTVTISFESLEVGSSFSLIMVYG